ncbi:hypothetical protein L6452_44738 [Arctium lappa]|nr:hypothetical protein L6452_44738 [Arctium lappa]
MIHSSGFNAQSRVVDVVNSLSHGWPNVWIERCPDLLVTPLPTVHLNMRDQVMWLNDHNNLVQFSVSEAWKRMYGPVVPWEWTLELGKSDQYFELGGC